MIAQKWEIALPNDAYTRHLGAILGRLLSPGRVLLLQGDLGSGKTTLVQGIGAGLGIPEPIVSPTFILLNEYPEGRIPLYHFDLYRLSSDEVAALQLELYWEGLETTPGIVAIEWPERLAYKPSSYLNIHLTYTPTAARQAAIESVGDFSELNFLNAAISNSNKVNQ
jgi:tRNA threonylcarbamoyladenosine biosynthesis protein TsaE